MSHTIEFDRTAVSVPYDPPAKYEHTTNLYLLLHKLGDSNMLNSDGTIAKEWQFAALGTETDVLKELTLALGDIEGGMLQYQNGRTKIENYLSNWRETIQDAPEVTDASNQRHLPDGDITITNITDPGDDDTTAWTALDTVTNSWERNDQQPSQPPRYTHDITSKAIKTSYKLYDYAHLTVDITHVT